MAKPDKKAEANKDRASTIARDTMTGDLRDCLLDFMKHEKNPLPWNMRPEKDQAHVIEKVTKAVQYSVEKAVRIIAADARATITGKLEKVTIKDGIKAEISLSKHDSLRHSLIDSQGSAVLMVIANSEAYKGEKKGAFPDPDEPKLLDDENEDDDGDEREAA